MTLDLLSVPFPVGFTHRGYYGDPERPVITVEFAAVDRFGVLQGAYETGVMVDSGAGITILNRDIATELGIDDTQLEHVEIEGVIPGETIPARRGWVMLELCGVWFQVRACFSQHDAPIRNLLGREGVFEAVLFTFRHADRAVYAAA